MEYFHSIAGVESSGNVELYSDSSVIGYCFDSLRRHQYLPFLVKHKSNLGDIIMRRDVKANYLFGALRLKAPSVLFVFAFLFILLAGLVFVNVSFGQSSQGINAETAPVSWLGDITINYDGSVSPSSAPIQQTGSTYNLTANIIGEIQVNKSNITINGNGFTLQASSQVGTICPYFVGFYLDKVNYVNITNIIVKNFYVIGDYLGMGFYLDDSSNNNIYGNTIINNYKGIIIDESSDYNNIYCNNITVNGSDTGVDISYSNFNSIFNNTLESNSYGVSLFEAGNNTIYLNNIVGNTNGGVYEGYSSNNEVYLNNLINNLPNAVIYNASNPSIGYFVSTEYNIWDNGSVGNYWSDYQTKYPNATEVGASGIWNTPYVLDDNNTDYYPLMQQINIVVPSTPSPKPIPTPAPTPTPSPAPSPTSATIQATTNSGLTVNLTISGNITSSQMSNVALITNQSAATTTLFFTVTGQSGTTCFGNITIPKSAVPYGSTPTVYVDNQTAQDQGYTQDTDNYYVWYTTQFSTHQISIVFTSPPSPTPPASPNQTQSSLLQEVIYGAVAVAIVAIVAVVLVLRKSKRFSKRNSERTLGAD